MAAVSNVVSKGSWNNNFNVLRLLAASSVLFSHAVDITSGKHDFLQETIGYSFGWIAVCAFFGMSGYLIHGALARNNDILDFLLARCLRILPGLFVMLIATTCFIGIFFTSLSPSAFFSDIQVYKYILGNFFLYFPQYTLPGVFEDNVYKYVVNGSLWTLRFEFTSYLIILMLSVIGCIRLESKFRIFIFLFLILYFSYIGLSYYTGVIETALYDGNSLAKLHRLFFAFFIGICVSRYFAANFFKIKIVFFWLLLTALAHDTVFFSTVFIIFICSLVFWFAFLDLDFLKPLRSMPDISYGVYIYAFPIQQILEKFYPNFNSFENAFFSLLLTFIPATISWFIVEKPSLKLRRILKAESVKSCH